MAELIIKEGKKSLMGLPHKLYLNNRYVCLLGVVGKAALKPRKAPLEAHIQLPAGAYEVRIQSMFPYFSSTIQVQVQEEKVTVVSFSDKEFWWDLVFWGDMAAWLLKMILHIGRPWSIVCEVISDVVFAIWLIHEFRIRKDYFKVEVVKQTVLF